MRSPVGSGPWVEVEEIGSTQDLAAAHVQRGEAIGVVFAHEQTGGRGRLGRRWHSHRGDSLTVSLVFQDYADHPRPHLIGMSVAAAAATALKLELRWPNDLISRSKKIGGVLTELVRDPEGRRIPIVGLGLNLNQQDFPDDIAAIAASLRMVHGMAYDAKQVLRDVLLSLEQFPEPDTWAALAPLWRPIDCTPGKSYRLATGEMSVATGIGPEGELLCVVEGEPRSVLAAEAIFGV